MPQFDIDIIARFAKFQDALDKIGRDTESFGKRLEGAFAGASKAAAVLGVALSVGAFAAFIKKSIEAQAHLADLSQKAGVAVETLGGLGFAAKLAGADLDGVAEAFGKFNVNIAKAAAGNEEVGAAFKALGLSVRDANGHIKTADALLLEIANKFERYADGPNKAALAQALFGKSYQSILQLLNEGGAKIGKNSDYWKQYAHVSEESAQASKELGDSLEKAKLHLDAMGNIIGNRLVGQLTAMAEAFSRLEESTGSLSKLADILGKVFSVITVGGTGAVVIVEQLVDQIKAMIDVEEALTGLDFDRARKIMDASNKARAEALKALAAFGERTMHPERFEVVEPRKLKNDKTEAPGLPDKGAADKALAEQKAILQQRLHAMRDWVEEEAELLKARNAADAGYYEAGLLGVRHFFALEAEARAEAIEKQRRAFAESEAALRDFIADPKVPQKDRIEAQTKLNDLLSKQANLESEAAQAGTKAWFDEQKAVDAVLDSVTELNAKLLENAGNSAEAERLRRAVADRALRRSLELNAPANVPQLDTLEAQQAAHDKLNDALALSDRRLAALGRAERQFQNDVANGALTSQGALEKSDAARKEAIADLEKQIPLLRENARLSGSPIDAEKVLEAEQRLKDLAAASHQVADQMRGVFEDAFVSPFEDLINHVKTADQALKAFFNNIAQGLLHIASKRISEAIFGNLFSLGAGLFGGAGVGTVAASNRMALGGVMTEYGPMKLERYASGGIASGPQLALFGEGRMREAYVPLPDGRSIPVSMRGLDSGTRVQAGPSAITQWQRASPPTVTLQIHPDAMHYTLKDWFESELARAAATR